MSEINEDVKIDIEEFDSFNDGEEINLEDLKLKGLNIACSLFVIVICYIVSFLLCNKALYVYGFKLLLINSSVIIPFMFVFLTMSYKKIGVLNIDIIKSILKKILLYLVFSVVSILFWATVLDLDSYKLVPELIEIVVCFSAVAVNTGSIASILAVLLYNLEKDKNESKVNEKVVLNVDIIKVIPVIFVFGLELFVVINIIMGLLLDNTEMMQSCIRLLSVGLTGIVSLIVALQGLVAGLFNINLKEVYKYVLLSMILGLSWSCMIVSKFILMSLASVLIGMVFGYIINLIVRDIKRIINKK